MHTQATFLFILQTIAVFSPAWHAFILSNEVQVDRVLRPENCEAYRDFATKFYDHELVKSIPS